MLEAEEAPISNNLTVVKYTPKNGGPYNQKFYLDLHAAAEAWPKRDQKALQKAIKQNFIDHIHNEGEKCIPFAIITVMGEVPRRADPKKVRKNEYITENPDKMFALFATSIFLCGAGELIEHDILSEYQNPYTILYRNRDGTYT